MNLYSKETRDDILLISKIRNKFAHFSDQIVYRDKEVREWSEDISLLKRMTVGVPGNFYEKFYGEPPINELQTKIRVLNFVDHLTFEFTKMIEDHNYRPMYL